jgi:peptide/nickel transport system substrate-binding protein
MAADPNYPMRVVMGTGPFRFVEHVQGTRWVGTRFEHYFREGLPYLDGFTGIFLSPSAVTQTLFRGRQILADFRTITPAERETLSAAMGDEIKFHESTGMNNLLLVFNTERPPFNDARVRRALSLAIDRRAGAVGMARTSNARIIGGLLRPGSVTAASDAELSQLPGFGTDIEAARAEARRLLAEAGVPNLTFVLTNRPIAVPFTVAGVYVLDQWRRIGVTAQHRQVETGPWLAALNSGNFEVIFDSSNEYTDDPAIVLPRYLSRDRSPANSARYLDRELDSLFDRQAEAASPEQRLGLLRAFETRVISEAYAVPLFWISRIVPLSSRVMGWQMSGSSTLGQDLAEVWLSR